MNLSKYEYCNVLGMAHLLSGTLSLALQIHLAQRDAAVFNQLLFLNNVVYRTAGLEFLLDALDGQRRPRGSFLPPAA